jgi:hypothetical protein
MVQSGVASQRQHLTTPNGDTVTTAALPSGDLVAAWRASNARSVVSATNMIPSGPAVRVLIPFVSLVSRVSVLRRFAVDRLAKVHMRAREMPREYSWGHCAMQWSLGSCLEGWLRLADAQEFTTAVTAEIARRLSTGEVRSARTRRRPCSGPSWPKPPVANSSSVVRTERAAAHGGKGSPIQVM